MESNAQRTDWVEAVYRSYRERVFVTCLRFAAGDRQWAVDRVQDVFLKLVERVDEIKEQADPGGWLYRVAVHTCCTAMRRQRTAWRILSYLMPGMRTQAPSADGQVRAQRALTVLEAAIGDLPVKQRAVMLLVHVENKSQREAAELLSLSEAQVSKLHNRALATLRARDWEIDNA